MLQPIAWEIQSESAVPNASRNIRAWVIVSRDRFPTSDVASVGIRQETSYADVELAKRIEYPVVARVDDH